MRHHHGVTRRSKLPAGLEGRPFAVATALRRGVSPERLRSRDLTAPFRGVRIPAVECAPDFLSLCRAYASRMPQGQFYSHTTAARLLGLPLPRRLESEPLHVSAFLPAQSPRAVGISGHRLAKGSVAVVVVQHLRVVATIDAWCQCGSLLSVDELVIAAEYIVGGRFPLKTVEQLRQRVDSLPGMRGVTRLRAAMELIRPGSESPKETELRLLLLRAGFPEPELNVDIFDRAGRLIGRGDLVFRAHKVLVEYDGSQHADDRRQFHRDVNRLDDFSEEDWRVVRVLKEHMRGDGSLAIHRVERALRSRGWSRT